MILNRQDKINFLILTTLRSYSNVDHFHTAGIPYLEVTVGKWLNPNPNPKSLNLNAFAGLFY